MAMANYQCPSCNSKSSFFCSSLFEESSKKRICPICKVGALQHVAGDVSSQVLERLDNGIMARPVLRNANAEERYKQNAAEDPKRRR